MTQNFEVVFMPMSVYNGLKGQGLTNEEIGSFKPGVYKNVSPADLGYITAINDDKLIAQRLFPTFPVFVVGNNDSEWQYWSTARQSVSLATYEARRDNELGQDQIEGVPPFSVVHGTDRQAIVVFGKGSLQALRKENIVLELVKSIVQVGLAYNPLPVVMGSHNGLGKRLVTASARVGRYRPPAPVYF